jgi:hypothetical protein
MRTDVVLGSARHYCHWTYPVNCNSGASIQASLTMVAIDHSAS